MRQSLSDKGKPPHRLGGVVRPTVSIRFALMGICGALAIGGLAVALYSAFAPRSHSRKTAETIRSEESSRPGGVHRDAADEMLRILAPRASSSAEPASVPGPAGAVGSGAVARAEKSPGVANETTSEEQRPLGDIEDRWRSESVDVAWAASARDRVTAGWRSAQVQGMELTSVDCRSTLCRLELTQKPGGDAVDVAAKLSGTLGVFKHMKTFIPSGSDQIVSYGLRSD